LTYKSLDIKSWAEEDRPREKLLLKGRSALSDAELIAILIGSGTPKTTAVDLAKQILKDVGNDLNRLARLSVNDLIKFKGIGPAKAIAIVSALELGRRRKDQSFMQREKVTSSEDVYNLMKPELLDRSHEEFWMILLNRANVVIKKHKISMGGISGTVADPRLIFKTALEHTACSVILVHNHPSGNLSPSEADKKLTSKMADAGNLLDIPVLDHIIFTDQGYFSFKDENLI